MYRRGMLAMKRVRVFACVLLMGALLLAASGAGAQSFRTVMDENADLSRENLNHRNWIHADEARRFYEDFVEQNRVSGVNVGVFDSTFYTLHPDLEFAEVHSSTASQEDLRDSAVRAIRYKEAGNGKSGSEESLRLEEDFSYTVHGTFVSALIGSGRGNQKGIDGMYPGANAEEYQADGSLRRVKRLYAYSYIDGSSSFGYAWQNAFDWFFDRDVKVINCSSGASADNDADLADGGVLMAEFLRERLNSGHDFLVVIAAGNDGGDARRASFLHAIRQEEYPDIYSRILVVGNGTPNRLSEDTGRGSRVDLLAPGDDVFSACPGGYIALGGTSASTPLVTGTAAMVWTILKESHGENLGPLVKEILLASASQGPDGCRYLDAEQAVRLAILRSGDPTGVLALKAPMAAGDMPALAAEEGYMENPGWTEQDLTGVLGEARDVDLDDDWLVDTADVYFHVMDGSLYARLRVTQGCRIVAQKDVEISPWFVSRPLYMPEQVNVFIGGKSLAGGPMILVEDVRYMEGVELQTAAYQYTDGELRFGGAFSLYDTGYGSMYLLTANAEELLFGDLGEKYASPAWDVEVEWDADERSLPSAEDRRNIYARYGNLMWAFGTVSNGLRRWDHEAYAGYGPGEKLRAYMGVTAAKAYVGMYSPVAFLATVSLYPAGTDEEGIQWSLHRYDLRDSMRLFREN